MSVLKNEKVIIKPVKENVAAWIPEGKDGRIRWENTSYIYDVPLTSSGVAKILTDEEQVELEKAIDSTRPKGWLSVYSKTPGIWIGKGRYKLEIPSEGTELDLSDPVDYIKYKIALAIKDDIAPSFARREEKKYLFYLEKLSNIERTEEEKIDKLMRANEYFSKIKDSRDKLRSLLLVINRGSSANIPIDASIGSLKTKVFDFIQSKTHMFLTLVDDEDYKYKVAYYRAMEKGAFVKTGLEIRASYDNGKVLGTTMTDAMNYIKGLESNKEDQQAYAVFLNRIKD